LTATLSGDPLFAMPSIATTQENPFSMLFGLFRLFFLVAVLVPFLAPTPFNALDALFFLGFFWRRVSGFSPSLISWLSG